MKILLLRHGQTAGNLEGRYVGRRTDEPLTSQARERLASGKAALDFSWEQVRRVYISPLIRCRETAELLFPSCPLTVAEGLAECDFGRFEYKNYRELSGDAEYRRFVDSGGLDGFPGGESVAAFKERCVGTFASILQKEAVQKQARPEEILAFVVHGGTIMAVMERFARPRREYFSWQTGNCEGYLARVRRMELFHVERVSALERLPVREAER